MRGVEYIGSLNAQLQRARFSHGDGLAQVHIKNDLPRSFNDIAPGVPEGTAAGVCATGARRGSICANGRSRRTKRRRIEPFESGGRAQRNGRSGHIGAQGTADAAADVQRIAEHARREVQAGANGGISAPLPAIQNVRERPAPRKAVVFAEGQLINPVSGEFMALVKTGKAAIPGDVERILSDYGAAAANRGSIVNRFGIDVGSRY